MCWDLKFAYMSLSTVSDVSLEARITLRVYEQHTFTGSCVGVMEYTVSSVKDQLETTLGESEMSCFIFMPQTHCLDRAQNAIPRSLPLQSIFPLQNW
jgi:hypothetical protein